MNIDPEKLAALKIDDTAPHSASVANKANKKMALFGATSVALAVVAYFGWSKMDKVEPSTTQQVAEQPDSNRHNAHTLELAKQLQKDGPQLAGPLTDDTITASGFVVAQKTTTVSSSVAGVVQSVHVQEGQTVEKGQLLAELENEAAKVQVSVSTSELETARLSLQEAKLQKDKLQLDLSRARTLAEKQMISDADLKQAQLNVDLQNNQIASAHQRVKLAEQRLALAHIDLNYKEIRAPFAGVVTEINAQPGEIVSPISGGGGYIRTGICTIADLQSLVVEVDINEKHLEYLAQQNAARIRLDAFKQSEFNGEVDYIVPIIDKLKGAVKVRIANTNFDHRALPGMGVQVWVEKQVPTSLARANHKEEQ